jgi:hypothetical protein
MLTFKDYILISEGGNVFQNTGRIPRDEVAPTIKHLEEITGLELSDNLLGSTGKAADSGDIDVVVDANKINKADLERKLNDFWSNRGSDSAAPVVKKSGISVHFFSPVWDNEGKETGKYVQVDFMFHNDPEFLKFFYTNNESAPLKGKDRNILLSAIAKSHNFTLSTNGLLNRETKQLITKDPNKIAKHLFGGTGKASDLNNVASLVSKLVNLYGKERAKEIVSDAEATTGNTFIS